MKKVRGGSWAWQVSLKFILLEAGKQTQAGIPGSQKE